MFLEQFLQYEPYTLVPKDLQTLAKIHPAKMFCSSLSTTVTLQQSSFKPIKMNTKQETHLPQATQCNVRGEMLWRVKLLSYSEMALIEISDTSMTQLPNLLPDHEQYCQVTDLSVGNSFPKRKVLKFMGLNNFFCLFYVSCQEPLEVWMATWQPAFCSQMKFFLNTRQKAKQTLGVFSPN